MRVKIYQINMDRDADNVKFMGTDARKSLHLKEAVDPSIYDEVFNAEIKETDPEEIYRRFNTEGHPLHRGHSLSVSDVVVTDQGAFFCDSIGFNKISFDESKTQKPENLMRVVYVEPGEKPYTAEILHTLQAEQKAVGGLIEPIYNEDDTILVGNEESKLIVPEEAAIVQRVFDMYLSGKSTDEISEILQAEKIVIPGKKLTFSKSMIIRMLKNEKYCGDAILQKTVTIDPISKKRKANEGEAPMWLVENSHPAIVTREIFNKAQEESARRKAKAPVSQKSAMTASGKYSKYALTEVMICGECGSRYKRVTWNIRGKRRIVWRCISRLDYGKKYCTESITVDEQALQRAIVRALNRFNVEDEATYLLLMKSTIGEAVGINGSSDEIDLLERRIDALNKRMLDLVSLSVQEGDDAENHEDDFKNISTQIEQLTKRITAIRESESENGDFQARLKEIQDIIDKRRENKDIYDDSIVRQMVECIKVYHDGRLQIILGGGYELEEYLEK